MSHPAADERLNVDEIREIYLYAEGTGGRQFLDKLALDADPTLGMSDIIPWTNQRSRAIFIAQGDAKTRHWIWDQTEGFLHLLSYLIPTDLEQLLEAAESGWSTKPCAQLRYAVVRCQDWQLGEDSPFTILDFHTGEDITEKIFKAGRIHETDIVELPAALLSTNFMYSTELSQAEPAQGVRELFAHLPETVDPLQSYVVFGDEQGKLRVAAMAPGQVFLRSLDDYLPKGARLETALPRPSALSVPLTLHAQDLEHITQGWASPALYEALILVVKRSIHGGINGEHLEACGITTDPISLPSILSEIRP